MRVQTRMQWKASENVDAVKYKNAFDALYKVVATAGIAGLYQVRARGWNVRAAEFGVGSHTVASHWIRWA